MQRDFRVEEISNIAISGQRYDLHNEYIFEEFSYDRAQRIAVIAFKHRQTDESLTLEFGGVSSFSAKPRDEAYPLKEGAIVQFIGFLDPLDVSVMDGFLPDDGTIDRDFIIAFQDEASLKVRADTATAKVSAS